MSIKATLVLATAMLCLGAACGTGDGGPNGGGGRSEVDVSGDLDEKPQIEIPEDAEPPSELVIEDLEEGDGAEAGEDAEVTAHYVGISWSSGEEFDSSWDRGQPATFPLAGVIPGWQQGIPGMKVGGRRLLVIPSELGYGQNPPPGSGIEPGETLVFVVDLVEVA